MLSIKQSLRMVSRIGLLFVAAIALDGCLNIPPAETTSGALAAGIPDHSAFGSTPCVSCHSLDRPAPTIDAVTGAEIVHGGGLDCGQCHVAGAPNWRTFTTFSHSPIPASCNDCHLAKRPTSIVNNFVHSYPGVGDCVDCHASGAGVTWTGGTYNHLPLPGTCAECHSAQRPTTVVNGFSHDAAGTGDCASCHFDVGVSWVGGTFSHSPTPATCSNCHAGTRPMGLVGPAPGFDHAAANGAGMGDCKSCHIVFSATQTDWSGGAYSHVPSPTTCIDCHLGARPVGLVGTPPFDHANGGSGDCVNCHAVTVANPVTADWAGASFSHNPVPATCVGCHAGTRPTGAVGPAPGFDHAIAGMGDCKACHAVQSATKNDWTGGNFSHSPTPATCINCHAATRPTGLVGPTPGFDHAIAGMGDCKSCHIVFSATKTDWTGGLFSHIPAPATCNDCHLAQRPLVLVGTPPFDHSNIGTEDCADCHHVTVSHPVAADWAGATGFDHATLAANTRCDSCHEAQRPSASYNVPWAGHASNPNKFLHSVLASVDCKGCHLDPGGLWSGAHYAVPHSPAPTQCNVCHLNQRPVGIVPGTTFDHAVGGTGDCGACHTLTVWTGGAFSHSPVPATCIGCHLGTRPTGAVGNPPFDHALNGVGLGDCKSCHAVQSPTKNDWTGGNFTHVPTPSTCAGCHAAQKPTVLASTITVDPSGKCCTHVSTDGKTYQNDFLHSLVSGDCAACHIVKSATQTNWTKGAYSHSPAPASCTTCHAITKPLAGASTFDHSQPGLADCKTCHAFPGQKWTGATALPSVVTLTPPTGTNWPNITAPHPKIDSAKVGLTCTTCHGNNPNVAVLGYDHAFPVTGVKCVYCHYDGQTETSASVTTKSHRSTSNTKDCNVSGCHSPGTETDPTWNATNKKFTGGKWGDP